MLKAFRMMATQSRNQQRYLLNSRAFSRYKEEFAKCMSSSQRGERNSQHGKRWICNLELRENRKIGRDDPLPEGWVVGRNVWNKRVAKEHDKRNDLKVSIEDGLSLLKDYENGMPMQEILIKHNRNSEQSVTTFLRKRFPNRTKFTPKQRTSRL